MTETMANPHADEILACYESLKAKRSNLVLELLKPKEKVYQWDHYPKGDVIDKQLNNQYYYHSHPSKDKDRVPEHGHFHVFSRLPFITDEYEVLNASPKHLENPEKDKMCHLFAIAMSPQGLPTALFTTNHWVVGGLWFSAKDTIAMLEQFEVQDPKGPTLTNRWINAMAKLFKEPLKALIIHRDQVITEWQEKHPEINVFKNKQLEITSVYPLLLPT